MDIDRYTVLGFMAVVVAPVTLVATAVSAMSSDAPKEKPVAAPAAVVSTQVVEGKEFRKPQEGDQGSYILLESSKKGNIVTALHKRVGLNNVVGYTRTESNCSTQKMRELGYSEEGPDKISGPATEWFDLVAGSSKADLYTTVCEKPLMTSEEKERKDFEAARSSYGYLLTAMIKKSAFDEDALKLKSPQYYKNGVCVEANGKNRFGAYVGWQEHCYLYKDGKWSYRGPN